MMRSAFATDEWVWSLTATRHRAGVAADRRFAVSRATTRAERLPAEPPATKQPPAVAGSSARSAMNRNTWFSA